MTDRLRAFLSLAADPRIGPQLLQDSPALLFSRDGERVLWANPAGLRLMGARDFAALADRRFPPQHPVARQVSRLARGLSEGGAPQVAIIRVAAGVRSRALPFVCRRFRVQEMPVLLAAGSGGTVKPEPEAAIAALTVLFPSSSFSLGEGRSALSLPVGDGREFAILCDAIEAAGPGRDGTDCDQASRGLVETHATPEDSERNPVAAPGEQDAEASGSQPLPSTDTMASTVEPAENAAGEVTVSTPDLAEGGDTPPRLRFVWQTDAEGRFVFVSGEWPAALGLDQAALIGRTLPEIAGEETVDGLAPAAEALAARDSWSGIVMTWARPTGRVRIELAALPVFGRDRAFEGYRGFGVIDRLPDDGEGHEATPEEPPQAPIDDEPGSDEQGPRPQLVSVAESPRVADRKILAFRSDRTHLRQVDAAAAEAELGRLAKHERDAFREIARALGARTAAEEEARRAAAGPAAAETMPAPSEAADEDPGAAGADRTEPALSDPAQPATSEPVPPEMLAEPEPSAARGEAGRSMPSAFAPWPAAEVVIDRLPVPALVFREERLLFVNRAALDLLGHASRESLEAAGGLESIFADDAPALVRRDGAVAEAVAVRHRDGSLVAVEAKLFCAPWNGRSALMVVLAPADTARSRLAAAQAINEELRAILDTATDGVVVLAGDGRIESVNRSAEALFGYESAEMLDEPFTMLLADESRRAALDYLDGLMRNGVASVLNDGREVIGRVRQGGLIPLFLTIGRIGGPEARRFCAVVRDISQWKQAEEDLTKAKLEAEQASSHKSDFLAKISHEIRTPLNAILGFSEVILEERFGPLGNERYRGYMRDIHTSGTHVISLVNDLLDLSKIEAGRLDLTFTGVSINEAVQQCVAIMQPQANRERIIIRSSLLAAVPQVVADHRSLRQIVLNLLSNSIKFTKPGGQVIVSTAFGDSGEVTLRVRDTGIGMTEAQINAALEPFRQLAQSSLGNGGTGLGLPLTKALVEANRATFAIESRPGSGTLVEISFPPTRVLAG